MGLVYLEAPPPLSGAGLQREEQLMRAGEGLQETGLSGHCSGSWLTLPQERWQWPGSPLGGSRPSPGPRTEEQEGTQGYSVLGSLVGPACIFLRPSIAATQLVCTVTLLPAGCSGPIASSLPSRCEGQRGRQRKDSDPRGGAELGELPYQAWSWVRTQETAT